MAEIAKVKTEAINPTHVGMNRTMIISRLACRDKPHARGDEPEIYAQGNSEDE